MPYIQFIIETEDVLLSTKKQMQQHQHLRLPRIKHYILEWEHILYPVYIVYYIAQNILI